MNRDEVEKKKDGLPRVLRWDCHEPPNLDHADYGMQLSNNGAWVSFDAYQVLEQRNRELEEEKKTRDMEIEKLKKQVNMFREKLGYEDHDPTGPTSDAECTSC